MHWINTLLYMCLQVGKRAIQYKVALRVFLVSQSFSLLKISAISDMVGDVFKVLTRVTAKKLYCPYYTAAAHVTLWLFSYYKV